MSNPYKYSTIVLAVALALLLIYNIYTNVNIGPKFGQTTSGIGTPLSASELSVINNASESNFITAGNMLLNGTLSDPVMLSKDPQVKPYVIGGKQSVIYIGAISCIYCGENRWAMALALSRFGNFSKLFIGYSSFGDGDIPTLYWTHDNYTAPGVGYGNYYSSSYINFISADYDSNITQGFQLPAISDPLIYYIQRAPNATYAGAMAYMNSTNNFTGTPFTLWGSSLNLGADGIVFGNTTPTSSKLPLTYMTHQQVFNQLKSFNDQFAYAEYAAADVYVAQVCASLNGSMPSICNSNTITAIEGKLGI